MTFKNIAILAIFIALIGNKTYAQTESSFKLRGIVKRSSSIILSHNQKGINYYHNSKQGTKITVDGQSFEYHSPGKFQIPLDNKRHSVTIQTI